MSRSKALASAVCAIVFPEAPIQVTILLCMAVFDLAALAPEAVGETSPTIDVEADRLGLLSEYEWAMHRHHARACLH